MEKQISGRVQPNPAKITLHTLYVNGKPACNHAYDYVTAVIVFKDRFFRERDKGNRVVIDSVRRGRPFVK